MRQPKTITHPPDLTGDAIESILVSNLSSHLLKFNFICWPRSGLWIPNIEVWIRLIAFLICNPQTLNLLALRNIWANISKTNQFSIWLRYLCWFIWFFSHIFIWWAQRNWLNWKYVEIRNIWGSYMGDIWYVGPLENGWMGTCRPFWSRIWTTFTPRKPWKTFRLKVYCDDLSNAEISIFGAGIPRSIFCRSTISSLFVPN